MRSALPRELRSWGDEIGLLFRRWWWIAALVLILSWFPPVPAVQVAFTVGCLAVAALLGLWFATTARRMPRRSDEKWKRDVSRNVLSSWAAVATRVGLGVQGSTTNGAVVPAISSPVWDGWTCVVGVALPQGLGREHLQAQADLLAQAFAARRATVHGEQIGALVLRLEYADALEHPFSLELPAAWDGKTVAMGKDATGSLWSLRLGPHTLVAGSSGSGKASLVWGLLLGLAEPIHRGLVEVWGIDRKGGMELALGRALLTRFAADAERSVILLEDAVAAMQQRANELAGKTRQHTPSTESPTVVVLIDELAALTAYETDRDLLRRANAALATLASQGRAVGFIVFACLQDPRKETLPARGLFTQTVGLRLRDRMETAMVLGDGAVAAGARCHEISPATPGVAYVLPEDGSPPERVRAGVITDDMIRHVASRFAAPRRIPVVIPEAPAPEERQPRPPRAPRTQRRSSRKESAS
ncbi:FtsK/SpoIIIE domain-containing protein [Microbacterium sp. NPDC089189]|uniref:FtsK/SpoIIIE domain-containing protein n=1 Tax=Microbacterium sp. NPDC089189 TaxID=3154972 RepID=UPI003439369C